MEILLLKEYQALNNKNIEIIDSNRIVLKGILQRANALNGNGRIYEKKILDREINKYRQLISEKRSVGEINHSNSAEVDLKNVSHIVEGYEWKGDELYGQIRLLNTTAGKEAQALIQDGITLGISTRGLGSVSPVDSNTVKVNEDYHLICWDLVHDPSTTGAFMLKEGKYIRIDHFSTNNMLISSNTYDYKLQSIANDILKKRK